jgi:hypothetical protein
MRMLADVLRGVGGRDAFVDCLIRSIRNPT